jgi:hypothetical protein
MRSESNKKVLKRNEARGRWDEGCACGRVTGRACWNVRLLPWRSHLGVVVFVLTDLCKGTRVAGRKPRLNDLIPHLRQKINQNKGKLFVEKFQGDVQYPSVTSSRDVLWQEPSIFSLSHSCSVCFIISYMDRVVDWWCPKTLARWQHSWLAGKPAVRSTGGNNLSLVRGQFKDFLSCFSGSDSWSIYDQIIYSSLYC